MYKIDRRGGGGVQKSFTRTDPKKHLEIKSYNFVTIFLVPGYKNVIGKIPVIYELELSSPLGVYILVSLMFTKYNF